MWHRGKPYTQAPTIACQNPQSFFHGKADVSKWNEPETFPFFCSETCPSDHMACSTSHVTLLKWWMIWLHEFEKWSTQRVIFSKQMFSCLFLSWISTDKNNVSKEFRLAILHTDVQIFSHSLCECKPCTSQTPQILSKKLLISTERVRN